MAALLREPGVVDDPPAALAEVHLRYHPLAHPPKHLLMGPLGLGHEVVQRLMSGAGVHRIDPRGHRLYALARQREHQARAVTTKAGVPVRVTQAFTQVVKVQIKALGCIHRSSGTKSRGSHRNIYDTVRLAKCPAHRDDTVGQDQTRH